MVMGALTASLGFRTHLYRVLVALRLSSCFTGLTFGSRHPFLLPASSRLENAHSSEMASSGETEAGRKGESKVTKYRAVAKIFPPPAALLCSEFSSFRN